jgi:hypothetical protein
VPLALLETHHGEPPGLLVSPQALQVGIGHRRQTGNIGDQVGLNVVLAESQTGKHQKREADNDQLYDSTVTHSFYLSYFLPKD